MTPCQKIRDHIRIVPGNKRAKSEVPGHTSFKAIYGWQCNDAIMIVTSLIRRWAHTERQNGVKTLYVTNSLHYT